jgi:lambda family phage portal protein
VKTIMNAPSNLAEHFDDLRSDYAAMRSNRFRRRRTGLAPGGAAADYHFSSESKFLQLMEQARDMDRNDVAVGPLLTRVVDNTVGAEGFSLDPKTPDPGLNTELKDRWAEWTEDADAVDIAGEQAFVDFERLALRSSLVDGDIVFLGTETGALQPIEAHRIRTPNNTKRNCVFGVLLDDFRQRLEYWVTKEDVGFSRSVNLVSDMMKYPVRDEEGWRQVFHVYHPKRVTATRGITAFAPIFDTLGQFDDVQFAKLVQQQIVSCFAILRERNHDYDAKAEPGKYGASRNDIAADGSLLATQGIAPGMEVRGNPGEQLKGFSPAVPNPEFFDHVRLILTLVGINLGMPLVLYLMDASETNYSGFRGALEQAKIGFRSNQQQLIRRHHRPIYWWKLRQWMLEDAAIRTAEAKHGKAFYRHKFNVPTWPYTDPTKDATADIIQLRGGLISPRRLQQAHSRDWDEISTEMVEDYASAIRKAKRMAITLNGEFPDDDPVHWRELLPLIIPEGMKITVDAGAEPVNDRAPATRRPSA